MSLVRRGGTIQSAKFAKKRRKKLIFAVVLCVVAIASVISTIFFFFRAQFVQIKSVQVSGPIGINGGVLSMVPADAVQAEITKDISDSWLYLFSKNTLFTYPAGTIRANLLKEYPAAQSVDFQSHGGFLGFGNDIRLQVFITERTPFALACDTVKNGTSSQLCFYIDSNGFVYAPVSQSSQISAINYIHYQLATSSVSSSLATSTFGVVLGKSITDPATFAIAQKIINAVSGIGLTVVGDTVGTDAYGPDNQILVSNRSASTTTAIYFNGSEPLDTELRYFSEFWTQESTSSATIFQYVDMRYGKDIVFKLYSNASSSGLTASSSKTKK